MMDVCPLGSEWVKGTILYYFLLQDCISFIGQIQKAVETICQLLGSKITTDILEAIQFFVTSFEFGVMNAMIGVRRMLALVWSKESGIKEAIANAYKRLYLCPTEANQR
jgi:condensin complex subunit 1